MTYGTGSWGLTPWGSPGAPTILEIATPWGVPVWATPGAPIVDIEGGDVIAIAGSNYFDPVSVELLVGGGPLEVVGTGYIFDPRYDVSSNKIWCGTPPLSRGTYHLRVTTPSGSTVLLNALRYEPIAYQTIVERSRINYSSVWAVGDRLLSGN